MSCAFQVTPISCFSHHSCMLYWSYKSTCSRAHSHCLCLVGIILLNVCHQCPHGSRWPKCTIYESTSNIQHCWDEVIEKENINWKFSCFHFKMVHQSSSLTQTSILYLNFSCHEWCASSAYLIHCPHHYTTFCLLDTVTFMCDHILCQFKGSHK